jgi:hypothetical protein
VIASIAFAIGAAAQAQQFHLSSKQVEAAFDERTAQAIAKSGGTYDPPFGLRFSPATCRTTSDPQIAECTFRVTYRSGISKKVTNHFKRIDQSRWLMLFN